MNARPTKLSKQSRPLNFKQENVTMKKSMESVVLSFYAVLMIVLLSTYGCVVPGIEQWGKREQPCTPAGTKIPFSKVMSYPFALNYIDCDISTDAQFVATGKGAWVSPMLKDSHYVVVRVISPGQQGEKNPLSGEIKADFVMVPVNYGDVVFSATAGNILEFRGGTKVRTAFGDSEVVFFATSVKKK